MPQSARKTGDKLTKNSEPLRLPVEVEVYVEPDGSVVFADLEAGMVRVAQALEPDVGPACDAPLPGAQGQAAPD